MEQDEGPVGQKGGQLLLVRIHLEGIRHSATWQLRCRPMHI